MSFIPLRKEGGGHKHCKPPLMMRTVYPPCHSISVELEELEKVLGLLPVSGLLLSRQGVIRHQQGVGAAPYRRYETVVTTKS